MQLLGYISPSSSDVSGLIYVDRMINSYKVVSLNYIIVRRRACSLFTIFGSLIVYSDVFDTYRLYRMNCLHAVLRASSVRLLLEFHLLTVCDSIRMSELSSGSHGSGDPQVQRT